MLKAAFRKSDDSIAVSLRARLQNFPLSDAIGERAVEALIQEGDWFSLPGGAELSREGAFDRAAFVVLTGCLGVYSPDENGEEAFVAYVPPGETVGEMSLIAGDAHAAKIVALRDTELLRIGPDDFSRLIAKHPRLSLALMRILVRRLRQTTKRMASGPRSRTFALLPLHRGADTIALAHRLREALATAGLKARMLSNDAANEEADWFHRVEAAHDVVVYAGDQPDSPWTQLCLRQADKVLLVAASGETVMSHPLAGAERGRLKRQMPELVVLRAAGRAATTQPHRAEQMYGVCYALDPHDQKDVAHLARMLTGRAVGLVFAGGGARGFAHIGVARALHEAGVPFDLLGGTSMGAIIAAGLACGWAIDELSDRMRRVFVDTNPLNDFTIPLIALFRGRKVTNLLKEHFGDVAIESLPRTFFCTSSDLTSGRTAIHRTGPVWRSLRASIAIPGLLPPVAENGHILVDGGLMNNFPVDIMARFGRGPIVGCDVTGDFELMTTDDAYGERSVWQLMRNRMRGVPSIVSILMRSGTVGNEAQRRVAREQTDLLFEPPLEGVGLRSWNAFDRAVEEGYRHAADIIEARGLPAAFIAAQSAA